MNSPRQGIKDISYICARHGLRYMIISPGSRNAPIILSFTQNKKITCLHITDERSAGYFALGIARFTKQPVGLLCTSGTATLNFGPAIAEACYQNLPLVVFTADRPPEWIDQADGQTIRQYDVFKNHVKHSFELPVETSNSYDLWYNNRQVSQAIDMAIQQPQGPVHINIPLREPLYDTLPETSKHLRCIHTAETEYQLPGEVLKELQAKWNTYSKRLIIAGFGNWNENLNNLLNKIAEKNEAVVIAENISNVYGNRFIYAPERLFSSIDENESQKFTPELLITIGKSIVSKHIKQFLRKHKPIEHWHIDPGAVHIDTFQSLSLTIQTWPETFFKDVVTHCTPSTIQKSNYASLFLDYEKKINSRHYEFLEQASFSDLKAFEIILETIPNNTNLHLANSSPIRYAQLFKTKPGIQYYCNRGTSGIDGCVSTAAGSAYVSGMPTTIIAGDLAFIYDSNALWNNYLGNDFRIIIINNGGGNIFRLIETSPEIDVIMDYFETPHQVNLKLLTEAFNIKYYFCTDNDRLKEQVAKFYKEPGPSVLEIKTNSAVNTKVFKEYYGYIKK